MVAKPKKASTKKGRVKVGKLPESAKELSAKEQQRVKGGGSYTVTVKVKSVG